MTRSFLIEPRVRVGHADTLVDSVMDEIASERKKLKVGDTVEIEYFAQHNQVRKGYAEVIKFHTDEYGTLIQLRPDWDGVL